jgi:hypothetical protein
MTDIDGECDDYIQEVWADPDSRIQDALPGKVSKINDPILAAAIDMCIDIQVCDSRNQHLRRAAI